MHLAYTLSARVSIESILLFLRHPLKWDITRGHPCVKESSLLSDDDPTGGGTAGPGSTWVGRSGGPSRDGRQRRLPGGSVGRASRPEICFAALRAAGRSVGDTESETLATDFLSRSLETQSVLSSSRRLTQNPTRGAEKSVKKTLIFTTSPHQSSVALGGHALGHIATTMNPPRAWACARARRRLREQKSRTSGLGTRELDRQRPGAQMQGSAAAHPSARIVAQRAVGSSVLVQVPTERSTIGISKGSAT